MIRRSTCSSSVGPFLRAGRSALAFGVAAPSARVEEAARPSPRALGQVRPAAVVAPQRALLDRDRPLGDGVEQGAVVRDEQQGAGEGLECRLERLAGLEVEVVRRLVEDEEVRARGDDDGEREPPPLPAREHRDRLLLLRVAGEEELAEQVLGLRPGEPGHRDGAVEHRAALVELDVVLGEVGGLDAVAEANDPRVRLALADERLEQGRLARAVRADEGDVLARSITSEPPSSSGLPPAESRSPSISARSGPSAQA